MKIKTSIEISFKYHGQGRNIGDSFFLNEMSFESFETVRNLVIEQWIAEQNKCVKREPSKRGYPYPKDWGTGIDDPMKCLICGQLYWSWNMISTHIVNDHTVAEELGECSIVSDAWYHYMLTLTTGPTKDYFIRYRTFTCGDMETTSSLKYEALELSDSEQIKLDELNKQIVEDHVD